MGKRLARGEPVELQTQAATPAKRPDLEAAGMETKGPELGTEKGTGDSREHRRT